MNHYVYQLTTKDNEFYIGVRSSKKPPTRDDLVSCGIMPQLLNEQFGVEFTKQILVTTDTREEAVEVVRLLFKKNKYMNKINCLNLTGQRVKAGNIKNKYKKRYYLKKYGQTVSV
jgi:hypothetical protein